MGNVFLLGRTHPPTPVDTTVIEEASLLRDLKIMMNLALGTSNIDAAADLLADATRINAGASIAYSVAGGKLSASKVSSVTGIGEEEVGYSATVWNRAQTFKATFSSVGIIKVKVKKTGTPTDNLECKIYATSGGTPTTLLYTATNTIPASSLTTSMTVQSFNFTGVNLTVGTTYAIVFARSGAADSTNRYTITSDNTNPYADGTSWQQTSMGSWTQQTGIDLYFEVHPSSGGCSVVWNPLTTAPLDYVAVSAIQTLGTGSVTYYVSDDGTTWVQILALDTAQAVNFTDNKLYLKAVITGDASIDAVAWGGF